MKLAPGETGVRLVTVQGRQYRKKVIDTSFARSTPGHFIPQYQEDEEDIDIENDSRIKIEEDRDGFTTKVEIPSVFYGFIIGKRGINKQRIEKETNTTIIMPKQNSKNEQIIIQGPSKNGIIGAYDRIEIICDTAYNTLPYTHFISIPLNMPEVISIAEQFNTEVIEESQKVPIEGFDPSIILSPKQLHLTILMLKLFTPEKIESAKQILKDITPKIYDMLATRTLMVSLKGLEIMNDDPTQVDILYLQVKEDTHRLRNITNFIVSQFMEKGFVKGDQERNVKLHATLMNTKIRKQEEKTEEDEEEEFTTRSRSKRMTFNARHIMAVYSNIDFGTVRVPEIHLSQRGSFDENGYFHCVDKVILP